MDVSIGISVRFIFTELNLIKLRNNNGICHLKSISFEFLITLHFLVY